MALKKEAKLIDDVLAKDITMTPTRNGYGEGVVLAADRDENVVVMCADLTSSTRNDAFKEKYPGRFIQMGVHEQLLASSAAGLALAGKVPFITSYAMFCPGRSWEMVRTNICLNEVNVNIIGSHAGVSVGPDGATHQAIEDIAIMRCIPRMTIIAPCDVIEARKATVALLDIKGPTYTRYAREKTPVFTTEATPFEIGRAEIYRSGTDVAFIACGPLVHKALVAAEELEKEGLDVMVVNSHTIKPLDKKTITAAAEKCGAIVTIEEHQVKGGLGGAVAEHLALTHPVPMEFIGVQDKFGETGDPMELIEHFGMGVSHIKAAAKKVLKRKQKS